MTSIKAVELQGTSPAEYLADAAGIVRAHGHYKLGDLLLQHAERESFADAPKVAEHPEMSAPQALGEINLTDMLTMRVRAGQPIYVTCPLGDMQAKLHAKMINRLMVETSLSVTVIHTSN